MKRRKVVLSLFCSTALLANVSCGGSSNEETDMHNVELTDSTETAMEDSNTNESAVDYSVPTPNELFEIIKLQGGEKQMGLVNPLENAENYVDIKSKSLNFGIYSADVAYLSCFGVGVDFLRYFKKIEELGDELGISGAFDEEMMDRIKNNEGNSDSLFQISNESYYNSYAYLEENEKGTELSLIMAGGYIESLYIITNLTNGYHDEDPIVQKVGDQKVVLENLMDFIEQYNESEAVSAILNDLADLHEVFETHMDFSESESSVKEQEGTLILSGGGSYEINEDAFNAISIKAEELRTQYTK